jgi:hypothetical protein
MYQNNDGLTQVAYGPTDNMYEVVVVCRNDERPDCMWEVSLMDNEGNRYSTARYGDFTSAIRDFSELMFRLNGCARD